MPSFGRSSQAAPIARATGSATKEWSQLRGRHTASHSPEGIWRDGCSASAARFRGGTRGIRSVASHRDATVGSVSGPGRFRRRPRRVGMAPGRDVGGALRVGRPALCGRLDRSRAGWVVGAMSGEVACSSRHDQTVGRGSARTTSSTASTASDRPGAGESARHRGDAIECVAATPWVRPESGRP